MVKFGVCHHITNHPVCTHFWEASPAADSKPFSKLPAMFALDSPVGASSGRRAYASFLAGPGINSMANLGDSHRAMQSADKRSRFLALDTQKVKPSAHMFTAFVDRVGGHLADPHHAKDIHADDIEDLADPALAPACRRWRVSEGLSAIYNAVPAAFEENHQWALGSDPPLAQLPANLRDEITKAVKPIPKIIEELGAHMYLPASKDTEQLALDQVQTDPGQYFATVGAKYAEQLEGIEKVLRDISHKESGAEMRKEIDGANRWRIQLTLDGLADAAKNVAREMRLCETVSPSWQVLGDTKFNIRSGMQDPTLVWDFGKAVEM